MMMSKRVIICLLLIATVSTSLAQESPQKFIPREPQIDGEVVYRGPDVIFRKLDDHTWVGSAHVMMESLYLVEGRDAAVLIDAGTSIKDLDKIVSSITDKPVTLIATHVHLDHTGSARCFDKVYINPADTINIHDHMPNYKGQVLFLRNHQKIRLGGRTLEVLFTPGHTPGSTCFIDKKAGYGFSGDSFGNGNLLLGTPLSTMISTCGMVLKYMKKNKIKFFYNGHFGGKNMETEERITIVRDACRDLLEGKLVGDASGGNPGMGIPRRLVTDKIKISYGDHQLK